LSDSYCFLQLFVVEHLVVFLMLPLARFFHSVFKAYHQYSISWWICCVLLKNGKKCSTEKLQEISLYKHSLLSFPSFLILPFSPYYTSLEK
jgi:hypothetical protein